MEKTKNAAPVLKDVKPIDKDQFGLIWKWIVKEMM